VKSHYVLAMTALVAGCAILSDLDPSLDPPLGPIVSEGEYDIEGDIPENIEFTQQGAGEGFKKGDGFFFTMGEGVVSLGEIDKPGLWVKSDFVESGTTVELHSAKTKTSVIVKAIKTEGSMKMSLGAFEALDLSPADLPLIEVRTP